MKKVIVGIISIFVVVTAVALNIQLGTEKKGESVSLNLDIIEALAGESNSNSFYCCSPYDRNCTISLNEPLKTVKGTRKNSQCK